MSRRFDCPSCGQTLDTELQVGARTWRSECGHRPIVPQDAEEVEDGLEEATERDGLLGIAAIAEPPVERPPRTSREGISRREFWRGFGITLVVFLPIHIITRTFVVSENETVVSLVVFVWVCTAVGGGFYNLVLVGERLRRLGHSMGWLLLYFTIIGSIPLFLYCGLTSSPPPPRI
jgi:hypothetical protein